MDSGAVSLGNDFKLMGCALEKRVKQLFESVEMLVENGRKGREDLLIKKDESMGCYLPIVVEVKSSTRQFPGLDYLRQLDDYVYELSQEKGIRYNGLNKWNQPRNKIGGMDIGAYQSPKVHPKRYKGLFLFNGSVDREFEGRNDIWLMKNQVDFAQERHFCCMTFGFINYLV